MFAARSAGRARCGRGTTKSGHTIPATTSAPLHAMAPSRSSKSRAASAEPTASSSPKTNSASPPTCRTATYSRWSTSARRPTHFQVRYLHRPYGPALASRSTPPQPASNGRRAGNAPASRRDQDRRAGRLSYQAQGHPYDKTRPEFTVCRMERWFREWRLAV